VDGLAATLGMFAASVFGAYFFMVGMTAYAILVFSMAGSLAAFLIFNYHPAKIFMGDCGSLMIGLVNAILIIKFITVADSSSVTIPIESALAIGISVLILPLFDTILVFGLRILKGVSPFSPDRTHIHHLLLERGLNHRYITFSCLLTNMVFVGLAFFARSFGSTSVFLVSRL